MWTLVLHSVQSVVWRYSILAVEAVGATSECWALVRVALDVRNHSPAIGSGPRPCTKGRPTPVGDVASQARLAEQGTAARRAGVGRTGAKSPPREGSAGRTHRPLHKSHLHIAARLPQPRRASGACLRSPSGLGSPRGPPTPQGTLLRARSWRWERLRDAFRSLRWRRWAGVNATNGFEPRAAPHLGLGRSVNARLLGNSEGLLPPGRCIPQDAAQPVRLVQPIGRATSSQELSRVRVDVRPHRLLIVSVSPTHTITPPARGRRSRSC